MKEFSKELRDMLTDYIVSEIGSKGLDGITYTMKINKQENSDEIEIFTKIREEADRCGYDNGELFRAFEVSNGVVFDMDIKAMSQILIKIAQSAASITGKYMDMSRCVYSEPEAVRKADIVRLGSTVLKEVESGKEKVTVALFNRNRSNIIRYTSIKDGEPTLYSIKAFKVRTNDIVYLNKGPLKGTKYIVTHVIPRYILPNENGLVTDLVINRKDRG